MEVVCIEGSRWWWFVLRDVGRRWFVLREVGGGGLY